MQLECGQSGDHGMKSTKQVYASFKDDDKRLKALISRDVRIVLVAVISALAVVAPTLLH